MTVDDLALPPKVHSELGGDLPSDAVRRGAEHMILHGAYPHDLQRLHPSERGGLAQRLNTTTGEVAAGLRKPRIETGHDSDGVRPQLKCLERRSSLKEGSFELREVEFALLSNPAVGADDEGRVVERLVRLLDDTRNDPRAQVFREVFERFDAFTWQLDCEPLGLLPIEEVARSAQPRAAGLSCQSAKFSAAAKLTQARYGTNNSAAIRWSRQKARIVPRISAQSMAISASASPP